MAVSDLIAKIFRATMRTEGMKLSARIREIEKKEKASQTEAQQLIDWYKRNRSAIVAALKKAGNVTFGKETDEWQFPIINPVPRTIRRLAVAYYDPPRRGG